jgi:hypothetical protein
MSILTQLANLQLPEVSSALHYYQVSSKENPCIEIIASHAHLLIQEISIKLSPTL